MTRRSVALIASVMSVVSGYLALVMLVLSHIKFYIVAPLALSCMTLAGLSSYITARDIEHCMNILAEVMDYTDYIPETPPPTPSVDSIGVGISSALIPLVAGYNLLLALESLESMYSWITASAEHTGRIKVVSVKMPGLTPLLLSIILLGLPIMISKSYEIVRALEESVLEISQARSTSKT